MARKHSEQSIERHAANCTQCLDATEQYERISMARLGYSSRNVWLDMIDDLHNWQEQE